MEDLTLRDYVNILIRWKKIFLAVFSAVFLASILLAANWSRYTSTATVQITPAEIATQTALLQSGANGGAQNSLADLRVNQIKQTVLATSSLAEIITKYDLYAGQRKNQPISDVADALRKKIKLDLIDTTLANPASAQRATADQLQAIAFTLAFTYNDPLIAQQVTNELVSRFMDEDIKGRRVITQETSAFLDKQIKGLEGAITEQERKIAEFRTANGDLRPEAFAYNQQALNSTSMNLQNITGQLLSNETAQNGLRAQMAAVDPYSRVVDQGRVTTTPTIQLKALKSEYTTLLAKYGSEHPDVIKTQRQIEALKAELGPDADTSTTADLTMKLTDAQTQLAALKKNYGPENPDVLSLERQIKEYKRMLDDGKTKNKRNNGIVPDADNPFYIQLAIQLDSLVGQHAALITQKKGLEEQVAKYGQAIAGNPVAEQQMSALTRDYENAQQRYRELKEKKQAAEMAEAMEQARKGQKFELIDPPDVPRKTSPSRIVLALIGFILAGLAGLASVAVAQFSSNTLVGPRHLQALTGVAPLVTIAYLVRDEERLSKDAQKKLIGGVVLGGLVLLYVIAGALSSDSFLTFTSRLFDFS